MYLRHLLLQLWQSTVRSEVIPPTLSDSKGEVCNEKQKPPLPGGVAIASSYIANVQICFSLEAQYFFFALGKSEHTRDCPPLLKRRQVQKMCRLTTLASRQTLIKSDQLIKPSEKKCILHCHSQLRVRTGSRSDLQCDTHSLMLTGSKSRTTSAQRGKDYSFQQLSSYTCLNSPQNCMLTLK